MFGFDIRISGEMPADADGHQDRLDEVHELVRRLAVTLIARGLTANVTFNGRDMPVSITTINVDVKVTDPDRFIEGLAAAFPSLSSPRVARLPLDDEDESDDRVCSCGERPALTEPADSGLHTVDGVTKYICGTCWLKENLAATEVAKP